MTVTALMRMTTLAAIVVASATSAATAQKTGADPHHSNATLAQATPGQAPSIPPTQPRVIPAQPSVVPTPPSTTPAQPGMMQPAQPGTPPAEAGMMRPGMMGHSMMGGMPMMGPRGHMMKVMFAIVDTNGDGALSFEEVMAVHKRIFDRIDANKDGKVTLEEMQTFMRE